MPQGVQRDVLLLEAWLVAGRLGEVDGEASLEPVATEPSAADRWE